MIGAVLVRLGYLRYLFRATTWKWIIHRLDYLVDDHLRELARLNRGARSSIHPSVSFRSAHNVHIGSDTRVQAGCVLWASPNSRITLGDYSGLGPGTQIYSSNHKYSPDLPYYRQPWSEKSVTIGRDCWIGGGSIILPGVTVGDGCVVAAGTVVTKDIPAGSVAAGVPAKVLKTRGQAPALPEGSAE